MYLFNNIEIIDLALYIATTKTLVISDIHIGYEEYLNKQGILIPRIHFKEQIKKIKGIINKVEFDTIVINGDLKHEYGTISETEWRNTIQFIDCFKNKKIVLVKGNHDNILGPIANKKNLKVVKHYMTDDILMCHGDAIIKETKSKKVSTIIIGHEHPAINIIDGLRCERFKCYLTGKFEEKKLIVQPSFNHVTSGTDIIKERLLSPFLRNISDFEVYVVDKEIYDFGKVKTVQSNYR